MDKDICVDRGGCHIEVIRSCGNGVCIYVEFPGSFSGKAKNDALSSTVYYLQKYIDNHEKTL